MGQSLETIVGRRRRRVLTAAAAGRGLWRVTAGPETAGVGAPGHSRHILRPLGGSAPDVRRQVAHGKMKKRNNAPSRTEGGLGCYALPDQRSAT